MEITSTDAPLVKSTSPITVIPYTWETPLRTLLVIVGIVLWILIIVSLIGIVYGIAIGLVLFFAHITMIAYIRGSSIKLSPKQMPLLYERVVRLSQRIGLKKVPDTYLLQSNGVLNAFATRLGSRNFIVLHSDIIRACGDNSDALEFVIGHELGHLHRGHLRWRWLKAPAMVIPLLGTAYSRACEYTCDKYGAAVCADPKHKYDGLCILAAGGAHARSVNPREFVAQERDLNTVLMKLGSWFSTHPHLSSRVAALEPTLTSPQESSVASTIGAILLVTMLVGAPFVGMVYVVKNMAHSLQDGITGGLKSESKLPTPQGYSHLPKVEPRDTEELLPESAPSPDSHP